MNYQIKAFTFFSILLSACASMITTTSSSNQVDVYTDTEFSEIVGYAQLLPASNYNPATFTPVIDLNSGERLLLNFDLLEENYRFLTAKIIQCESDWTASSLQDIEYLDEYNEFPINDYVFSESNYTPFVNYTVPIPQVTKSGNYAVEVYDDDTNELLFTRRFLVYEKSSSIDHTLTISSGISDRSKAHQIEFAVNYGNLQLVNPLQDISVILLQNHNWNIAIDDLQPTDIRTENSMLEYRHFNLENNFYGLNEFRFFDIRLLSSRGNRISRISTSTRGIETFVEKDKSRETDVYKETLMDDLNGAFYLRNIDINESQLQSEYVWVHFELDVSAVQGDLYVTGKFNNWQLQPENRMIYDPQTNSYKGEVYLKQGYYNYMYFLQAEDTPYHKFEGTHFQTRNFYEILVYYREPGTVYDRLVGYRPFLSGN
jgi:hypothetical protein